MKKITLDDAIAMRGKVNALPGGKDVEIWFELWVDEDSSLTELEVLYKLPWESSPSGAYSTLGLALWNIKADFRRKSRNEI